MQGQQQNSAEIERSLMCSVLPWDNESQILANLWAHSRTPVLLNRESAWKCFGGRPSRLSRDSLAAWWVMSTESRVCEWGWNRVTVGYISIVILAWFPMEKIHSRLCCVTVRSSHAANFESVGQSDRGMAVTNMLWSCTFCREKGVGEIESYP